MEYPIHIFLVRLPSAATPGPLGQSNPWISLCESFSPLAEDLMSGARPFGLRSLGSQYREAPPRSSLHSGGSRRLDIADREQIVLVLILFSKRRPAQPQNLFEVPWEKAP